MEFVAALPAEGLNASPFRILPCYNISTGTATTLALEQPQHYQLTTMAPNHTFPSFSSLLPSLSNSSPSSSSLSPFVTVLLNSTSVLSPEDKNVVSNNRSALLAAFILSLAFLLGVPGNLFIVWSILARARKRSVTTLLILNLACADGFLMALSVFFVVYLATQSWLFGSAMCKVLFYLCLANMYASILLITLLSLHRLVVVREARLCVISHTLPQQVVLQYSFETLVGFVLPYGVIICSYVRILRRLRKTRFQRRIRSEKLILLIIITFGLLWLPYHVINVIQVLAQLCQPSSSFKERLDHIWQSSRVVTSALAFISSCVNPVLYVFAGKAYMRQDGLAFMARLFEGMTPDAGIKRGHKVRGQTAGHKDAETESSASVALSPTTDRALNSGT
ncbi:hypothetical protein AAFF_G00363410 [Aldrovandia affinis]|uniref:G-protein coupled receptors family 1 profile domain-containing protein n=1 Tax=Aldrovandia affinis TaxID=143900 RepID=A0AAD7VYM7_9TELE|nr:hypothetical protein AAFF_G00363410 [Aldrovandia affinis]